MLCAWTRSHVWHMKVLLYAVFKVRGLLDRIRRRSHRVRAIEASDFRTLKAEQCSPDEGFGRTGTIVLRETLVRGPRNRC
jgi:hypothetical protein